MDKQTQWRNAFNRQPAQFVVLDAFSMTLDVMTHTSDSLKNILNLCSGMKGSPRIPCFSLFLIGENEVKVIIPPQSVQYNKKFSNLMDNVIKGYQDDIFNECTDVCFRNLFLQINNKYQEYLKDSNKDCWQTLQVTIITTQKDPKFTKQLEDTYKNLQINELKKIQVIILNNPQNQELISSPPLWLDEEYSYIEILNLDCDPYQLENHFKQWLRDYNSDAEHLHLNIHQSDSDILKIKCDFHECLINPDILMSNANHGLSADIGFTQFAVSNQNKNSHGKIPIPQLQVINIVNASGICESTLYGQPMILIPTRCWKLDWEELEKNQQIFLTVCQLLKKNDSVLVAKKYYQFRHGISEYTLASYMLLFPSGNNSLLIKLACSREMLLSTTVLESNIISDDTTTLVQKYLDALQKLEEYNPVYYQSGLYIQLSSSSKSKLVKRPHPHKIDISSEFCKVSRLLGAKFPTKL